MELITVVVFCILLLACISWNLSILYALAAGLLLFLLYGRRKGFLWVELKDMALSGLKTVKNMLLTFLLIGMMTALWRAAGTVPVIVCYAAGLIRPSVILLMTFWLNCGISVLTGTAFGTAATMGVICMTVASGMQIDPLLVGGAVLSGVFFGDRCSPVSTSALLVSELTGTVIFDNIKRMIRSSVVPFLLTSGIYALIGLLSHYGGELPDLAAVFGREFVLSWIALLPAILILLLSLKRVNVRTAMSVSILSAIPICVFVQRMPLKELPMLLLTGYRAGDAEVGAMLNGGGMTSMLQVAAIISISSAYAGIFRKTGLLDGIKDSIQRFSRRTNPYAATLLTGVIAAMMACNQVFATMLTAQLCGELQPDKEQLALDLEDTAIVISPLIPWSIASAVPLSTIGAPAASVLLACYLYLLPLWRLLLSGKKRKNLTA